MSIFWALSPGQVAKLLKELTSEQNDVSTEYKCRGDRESWEEGSRVSDSSSQIYSPDLGSLGTISPLSGVLSTVVTVLFC